MAEEKPNSGKSWTTINIFGSSSQKDNSSSNPSETLPQSSESTGLLRGAFGTIKTKFLGITETVVATSNVYKRDYKTFGIIFGIGLAFIAASFFFLPLIVVSPYKFCIFFTVGNVCAFVSFAFLTDPWNYIVSQFKGGKAIFTIVYIASLVFSIYASVIAKNYIATIVVTSLQMVALISFTCWHFPGGLRGLKFLFSCIVSKIKSCCGRMC
eukprot:TRINITY_DN9407_c0_g2_i4.p1 TRINITY_DN9407_c0_g2~~TRINITY_DN9407_c0_g2_i4.p1  ORF type:complete len:211 (-),score=17.62 TRINITY_DN9407_c0_g2_i4:67-699(-)